MSARDTALVRAAAAAALVLLACIATFFAAGGERWKRVAAAFDWQGVTLPADFRVDAWVAGMQHRHQQSLNAAACGL